MKKFLLEFKEFINRGNVMDLAVGIIIGGAFTAIVTALTTNIINPTIEVIAGGGSEVVSGLVVPGTNIDFGAFISAIINFLIIALVVFLLIKAINKVQQAGQKVGSFFVDEDGNEVIAPTCPFCKEEVAEGATRCPHCTSEFDEPAQSTVICASEVEV